MSDIVNTTEDELNKRQAIDLAHLAARALEEARTYVEEIKNSALRKATEEEVDRIIEEL